jgi:hypothetical protein
VEGILTTILPAEVIDERQIRYQETSGEILYTFTGDGTVLVEAQDFRMTAAVDAGEIDLDLVVALDGTGSARYREDRHRGTLHLSDPNIDQVGIKATLGGISILQGIPIHYLVWFGSTDNQAGPIPYECGENTLSVTGPRIQKDTPPVTFILIRN